MRTLRSWRVALVSVATVAAGCGGGGGAPLSQIDADAIRKASEGYAEAATVGVWQRWALYFTEDGAFLPPNSTIKNGRAAIEAWGRSYPTIKELHLDAKEIVGRGDLAYVVGTYTIKLIPQGQPESADTGKYIEIWQKQPSKIPSWKLLRDIYNSDLAAPAASPARKN